MLRRFILRRASWLIALCVVSVLALGDLALVKRADLWSYDLLEPVFRPAAGPAESVIVAVDERTLSALGQWPWDRSVHARMVDILTEAGAAAITMSILFSEPASGDHALALAMEQSGRVVLPVAPRMPEPGFPAVLEILPIPPLSDAAAALGHVDVELDADALARRTYFRAGSGSPRWDALALAALKLVRADHQGKRLDAHHRSWVKPVTAAWHRSGELLLPFPDGRLAPQVLSYFDVLSQPIPARGLAGRAVFVGTTASGLDAGLSTPASPEGQPMSAVEFHARAFEALRKDIGYRTAGMPLTLSLSLAFLLVPTLVYPLIGMRAAIGLGVYVLVPFVVSGLALHLWQLWIPAIPAALGFTVGYLGWFAASLRRTRGSLQQARRDADATLRSIADGVITLDGEARVVLTNPVVGQLTGRRMAELHGEHVHSLLRGFTEQASEIWRIMSECQQSRRSVRLQEPIDWLMPSGKRRALQVTVTPIGEDSNGAVLVLTDVSEMLAASEQLRHEATHDALTGLPNRLLLLDRLQQALTKAARQDAMIALLFVDLDRFKRINDSLGHSVGDEVLRVVARRLSASVREGDTVSRWGGDEFIILMESLKDRDAVVAVANKVLGLLEGEFSVEGEPSLVLSCSVGIALGPHDSADPHALLSMADQAMYQGKLEGGSGYSFYSPEMNTWTRDRLGLESALRAALSQREFELFYQPQIDIACGQLVGFEALIRWRRPGQGLVRPDLFIPVAEESGIICGIGEWVIHEAVQQMTRWRAEGLRPVGVAINISARQCIGTGVADTLRDALASSGLETALLKVEVTESTAMKDPEHAANLLRSIHALGVEVSVDDFGTGYSSLSLLRRFPISELKIDRSFVSDVVADGDDASIVRGMIALSHGMGMKVVAEGVETAEQLRFLACHGCDIAQGYLFSPPLPAAEARKWMVALPEHVTRIAAESLKSGN